MNSRTTTTNDLISCLSRTLRAANRYIAEQLEDAGLGALSPSHGDILAQLFINEPLTMQDLSESIQRDPSTVTALVKKLVDADYVETSKSAEDGRVTQVRLTDKGCALKPHFESISTDLVNAQERGISAEDLKITRRTLQHIGQNLTDAYNE